jgi:hypothetical protein
MMANGLSDMLFTLVQNDTPILTINCSYTTAKTLVLALQTAISNMENVGVKIHNIPEINALFKSSSKQD